jgi:4-hydroxy-3-polyprenylbenzoate decarboxylase
MENPNCGDQAGMRSNIPDFPVYPALKEAENSRNGEDGLTGDNTEAARIAALGDLRQCLELAEEMGELERVDGADPRFEMGALYELSLDTMVPPILLFENMLGTTPGHRVVVNVRSCAALNQKGIGMELVEGYRRGRNPDTEPIDPEIVNGGPVFENRMEGEELDIRTFPAPVWHDGDGGHYIGTECMIIMRDPDTGWVNAGTYRTQVHDEKTLSIMIEPGKHGDIIRHKYWARGESCPVAITVGQAPVLSAVAASRVSPGQSEFAVAGGRIGRAIQLVDGPVTGLPFPADAEIAFEGVMPPPSEATIDEGPFGEWPGYYASGEHPEPIVRVAAAYHRDDPIVTGAPPAKPTLPGTYYGTAGTSLYRAASLWDDLEAAGVPGIKGVWKMPGGGSRFIDVIAIEQLHAGHAKMAGLVAVGCNSGAFAGRMTIIVDDDIDITSTAEVMWAMATRWDPKTQTDIIADTRSGNIDPLIPPDKRKARNLTNSRIIIYAVRPFHWKDDFPKVNMVDRDYADEVRKKWASKLPFLNEEG